MGTNRTSKIDHAIDTFARHEEAAYTEQIRARVGPFRAVDVHELRRTLFDQCSPAGDTKGYVLGPDITGRLCHCATCFSMAEARATADKMNTRTRVVRDWECICGHKYTVEVKHSPYSQNLTGESTAWCPSCGQRPLIGSPHRFIASEN